MAEKSIAESLEERIASIRAEAEAVMQAALREGTRADIEAAQELQVLPGLQEPLLDGARRESDKMQAVVLSLSNEVSHLRQEERMKTIEHAKAVEANTISQSRMEKAMERLTACEGRLAGLNVTVADKARRADELAALTAQDEGALLLARSRNDEEQRQMAALSAQLKLATGKVQEGNTAIAALKDTERGAIAKMGAAQEEANAKKFKLGNAEGNLQAQLTRLAECQIRQSEAQRVAAAATQAFAQEDEALTQAERTLDELLLALKMQEMEVAKHREVVVKAKVEVDRQRQAEIAASQRALDAQQTLARMDDAATLARDQYNQAIVAEQEAANALNPLRGHIAELSTAYNASLAECEHLQKDLAHVEMASKAAQEQLEELTALAAERKREHVTVSAEVKVLQEELQIVADEVVGLKAKLPEYASICHTTAAIEAETLLQLSTSQKTAADMFQNLTDAEERLFQCRLVEVQHQRPTPAASPAVPIVQASMPLSPRPHGGYGLTSPGAAPKCALSPARLPPKQ